jgi:hypothetical protein
MALFGHLTPMIWHQCGTANPVIFSARSRQTFAFSWKAFINIEGAHPKALIDHLRKRG